VVGPTFRANVVVLEDAGSGRGGGVSAMDWGGRLRAESNLKRNLSFCINAVICISSCAVMDWSRVG